jgi:L-rhamnonate dehydratase
MSMKIARVSSSLLHVPFRYPLIDEESTAKVVFVEVETGDGVLGHAAAGYPMASAIKEFINDEVASAIAGMDPRDTEAVQKYMFWALAKKYFAGAYACAASLIDVALWDIKGKAAGMPVWRLLGGTRQTVPTYVTFGLPRYTTEQLIEVALILKSKGHTSLKMVVGSPSERFDELYGEATDDLVDHDASRVHALREAVGPEAEIMIDANKNSTYPQALRLAKLVESANLIWYEDPVLQADPRLMNQLRSQTSVPIAGGSTGTADLFHLREYLIQDAVDYLQPNVRDIGGFTGGLKAAGLAQAFNVSIQMGGNWPHMNAHLHAGVPNGGRVEFHWQGWQMGSILYDGAPDPEGNWLTLPDKPGLGYEPKDGIVREFARN